jgi:hypothetical protein
VALAALCAAVGCTPADARAPGIQLTTVIHGDDVTLTWDGQTSDVVVEFATERAGPYTVLDFVPRTEHRYEHLDLMPATTFHYRVRPVEGPVSAAVTAVPGPPARGEDWLVPRTAPDGRAAPRSGGAPENLLVESVGADALLLTWTDNATDEDGYLVEHGVAGTFDVAFVVDPDVNRVGLIAEGADPADTYRVRAFHYGVASAVAWERTPG